ncbi:MAG: alpha/beta hydrolase [Pseudomonadota bacterium]
MGLNSDKTRLDLADVTLECAWHGPPPDDAPTIVMLHEGLGCVSMWKDFPQKLTEATGCGVFVYSRAGYGASSPVGLPRPITYQHDAAMEELPKVLDAIGFQRGILLGHSDGGSIATIYAGSHNDFRVKGLFLLAPHFMVEDQSVKSIAEAKIAYETGDLKARLARHHGDNVNCAFYGWNGVWLNSDYRDWSLENELAHIRVPITIVQGADDHYGTPAQLEMAKDEAYCPVETELVPDCGHSPHVEQLDLVLDRARQFCARIWALEKEGAVPA